jgi:rSAM/selenodomain-associated transferase 1
MRPAAIIVMAKSPVAGRVKTRLSPPLSLAEAAAVAEAALKDTLAAVAAAPVDRRVLALDGEAGSWLLPEIEVIPQRGNTFGRRLAAAFEDVGGPALLIGMDTPQITPGLLDQALQALKGPGTDAVLGLSADGGWWALGLRALHSDVFDDVPMSSTLTGTRQINQLFKLGLAVAMLPVLRDIDLWSDVLEVAKLIPGSMLADQLSALRLEKAVVA